MNSGSKILVRTPNWVGDHVMAMPFYESLRLAYPKSEIHFLSGPNLETFPDQTLCQKKLIFTPGSKRLGDEFFKLVRLIRSERYDLAVSLTASVSSSLLLKASHIPNRVGFSQGGSGLFLTDALKWKGIKSGKHKSEVYLELLDFMTGKHWHSKRQETSPRSVQKRILVAPGASIPLRVWPYFEDLILKLSLSYPDFEIAVVGGKGESTWHNTLEDLSLKNVKNYIEKTSLVDLIQLCRDSSLVVANDSGVGHLAGTLAQVPTVVIFGPGEPRYIKPLGQNVACVVPKEVPCHPCEKPKCHERYGYQACLKAISLEAVLAKICALSAP